MPTASRTKEFKFNLGADPEFNLEVNNNKLHAQNAISAILEKNKVFKAKPGMGYELPGAGTMGWDGHNATGEIRPNPSPKPEGIVENLKKMFEEFHKVAPLFEISTLSRTGVIGGHVHLELPIQRPSPAKMKAIHKRMISLYLPIIMGECKVNLNIRTRGGYGNLCHDGAYRVEKRFNHPTGEDGYTYELRCPSAEWATTPKIATATLAYLGVVFNEIMNHPKHFEKVCKEIIIRTDVQGSALQTLAMCEYKALTNGLFNDIKKCIKTFELYSTFKEEIDYILTPEKVLADKQNANYDIRIGWGLATEKKEPGKRTIVSEKAVMKIAKEKDLDIMSKFIKVSYNEDVNVSAFAQAISKRAAAFNWKLNKNYFLFGIRKGITDYIVTDNKGKIIIGKEMIKTVTDSNSMDNLLIKMRQKAQNVMGNYGGVVNKLNFKTGKVERIQNETIIIGIPYEDRINNKTKKFIELIYDLDKGKTKEINRKSATLVDDTLKPEEEKGEIYKILNGIEDKNREVIAETSMRGEVDGRTEEIMNEIVNEEMEVELITGNASTPASRYARGNVDFHNGSDHSDSHCLNIDCDECNDEFGEMDDDIEEDSYETDIEDEDELSDRDAAILRVIEERRNISIRNEATGEQRELGTIETTPESPADLRATAYANAYVPRFVPTMEGVDFGNNQENS